MADAAAVLTLRGPHIAASLFHDTAMRDIDFEIRPGELALIHAPMEKPRLPFGDAAVGLVSGSGIISVFGGRAWRDVTPQEECVSRYRVGRVLDGQNWMSNLTLRENLSLFTAPTRMLSKAHHERVDALVSELGLHEDAQCLGLRPSDVPKALLTKFAWVRALLNGPDLLILERPTEQPASIDSAATQRLLDAVQARKIATVWITCDLSLRTLPGFAGATTYALNDELLEDFQ